ncbi:hypothetical protein [Photobacterium toruni]|uniref:Uncharacterized protein n=1 Tax=Photobacterium toruni TaxID=1935446 RepID=A0A1T4UVM4_9GAMM|nr:hypothetical protein [Photobacterium toruni]SKA56461.1 hypothetical protein CZ814_03759 [Photobacterium toruni]
MNIFNKWIIAAATNTTLNKKDNSTTSSAPSENNALDIDLDITTQLNKLLAEQKKQRANNSHELEDQSPIHA